MSSTALNDPSVSTTMLSIVAVFDAKVSRMSVPRRAARQAQINEIRGVCARVDAWNGELARGERTVEPRGHSLLEGPREAVAGVAERNVEGKRRGDAQRLHHRRHLNGDEGVPLPRPAGHYRQPVRTQLWPRRATARAHSRGGVVAVVAEVTAAAGVAHVAKLLADVGHGHVIAARRVHGAQAGHL